MLSNDSIYPMTFELHPQLAKKSFVTDLPLCRVLLQDEKNYPWLFLVPRRHDVLRMMDLTSEDQLQLMREIELAQKILWEEFKPTQLNVAAIGNKTPQLHIHVIARFDDDPAWPNTVWDHPVRVPYEPADKMAIVQKLNEVFSCSAAF